MAKLVSLTFCCYVCLGRVCVFAVVSRGDRLFEVSFVSLGWGCHNVQAEIRQRRSVHRACDFTQQSRRQNSACCCEWRRSCDPRLGILLATLHAYHCSSWPWSHALYSLQVHWPCWYSHWVCMDWIMSPQFYCSYLSLLCSKLVLLHVSYIDGSDKIMPPSKLLHFTCERASLLNILSSSCVPKPWLHNLFWQNHACECFLMDSKLFFFDLSFQKFIFFYNLDSSIAVVHQMASQLCSQ